MSTTVDAIYENGVSKPEKPVELEDKTKVHLVIEKVAPAPAADDDDPTGWKTIDRLTSPTHRCLLSRAEWTARS